MNQSRRSDGRPSPQPQSSDQRRDEEEDDGHDERTSSGNVAPHGWESTDHPLAPHRVAMRIYASFQQMSSMLRPGHLHWTRFKIHVGPIGALKDDITLVMCIKSIGGRPAEKYVPDIDMSRHDRPVPGTHWLLDRRGVHPSMI